MAIGSLIRENHGVYDAVMNRIVDNESPEGGLTAVIAGAPKSNIALNITVTSRSGRVLLVQRTEKVRTWKLYFQAGPHETMDFAPKEQYQENCFDLARRALWEELGLVDSDLSSDIVFSWFGYYVREAQAYFFAHVETKLNENEFIRKARKAKSAFENGRIVWLELNAENVKAVLDTWKTPWSASPTEREPRQFLPHAAVSLTQLYRVKDQRMFDLNSSKRG